MAGGDPGVAPAGERAHEGAVVGGGGRSPTGFEEVAPSVPARRQALAQELVEAGAVTLTEKPAPDSKVPPQATRPRARARDSGSGAVARWAIVRLRIDAEVHDLPLRRADGQTRGEPLSRRRRPGAAGHGDGRAGHSGKSLDRHGVDVAPTAGRARCRAPRPRRRRRRAPPRPAAAPPPCPGRRQRAEVGACRTRWTGPRGGKSAPASSGVISATSPGADGAPGRRMARTTSPRARAARWRGCRSVRSPSGHVDAVCP